MKFHWKQDRNGTEDEISIRTPSGRQMAFIWFWDEEGDPETEQAKADATLIVNALNAYQRPGLLQRIIALLTRRKC